MRRRLALIGLSIGLSTALAVAQPTRVTVTFAPQSKDPKFDTAADEYRQVWAAEGPRIIDAPRSTKAQAFPGAAASQSGCEPAIQRISRRGRWSTSCAIG